MSDTEQPVAAPPPELAWRHAARRFHHGARRSSNWVQLLKFGAVGASGYAVNLVVFALLTEAASLHHILAAIGAFLVAVAMPANFVGNKLWTFA